MAQRSELTLERVAHYPLPGMNVPGSVRFSPDGRLLTYLYSEKDSEAGSLTRELWAFDRASGAASILARAPGEGDSDATVSHEEALRRERQRVRGAGITQYAWAEKAPVLLVPVQGVLYVTAGSTGALRRLDSQGEAIGPQLNPAGDAVAYVQAGNLWVLGLDDGARPRQVTRDASAPGPLGDRTMTNGLAEFVAQEEMDRADGFWWSTDGKWLAYEQADVSAIPTYAIVHQGGEAVSTEQHRYPFAGAANARVRLGVVPATGGETRWLPLGDDEDIEDIYLARVDWTPDNQVVAQVLSRDQKRLEVVRLDPATGARTPLFEERSDVWVNLHSDLRFVQATGAQPDDYQILWSSERSGYRHLYLYSRDGREERRLTFGEWPVDAVTGANGDWVYFLAGRDTPLERRLYRVALHGAAEPECLTPAPGMHQAVLAPSGDALAVLSDSLRLPPCLSLIDGDGRLLQRVFANEDDEAERLGLRPPEQIQLSAEDGTPLYGALYRPSEGSGPWPVVVDVYGGPHAQQVTNSWLMTVDLRAQYLARQGFLVFVLDNRGSARRGLSFEAALRWNMGDVEVRDQVAGIHALAGRPEADTARVGVYGWSYGGYMTLMCLLRAPQIFKAGVAGAPVTGWDGYDTCYTERYMGLPSVNGEGYRVSSAMAQAEQLQGKLLLIHGMIDENVHFRHTARLVNALVSARKPFELLPFPNERHMPRGEQDRVYLEQRLVDHFRRHLT